MAEPTLVAVFGANATQTSSQLVITKADLTGLTPSGSNTAESLVAGQLILWETTLSATNQNTNSNQSIRVERGGESIVTDFNTSQKFIEVPFTVTLRKPYTSPAIDPDDY